MPAQYLAIKKSELESGKSKEEAERIAAATYNKTHKENPVGPHSDDKEYSADSTKSNESNLEKLRNKLDKNVGKNHPRPTSIQHSGMKVMIENPEGSYRHGIAKDGKKWSTLMHGAHYGYFPHSKSSSNDGESLDCFVGPHQNTENVHVVHTQDPKTKEYLEDKVMLGWDNPDEAKGAFLSHYDTPEHFRSMTTIPLARFREMLTRGKPDGVRWSRKHRRTAKSLAIFSTDTTMPEERLSYEALLYRMNFENEEEIAPELGGHLRRYNEDDHRRDAHGHYAPKGTGPEPKKIGMNRYSVHPSVNGTGYDITDSLAGNKVIAHFPDMPSATAAASSRNAKQHPAE